MNKKKITPALLSGMMTISMGTTPISVLAQEEQPQDINETNVEQVNEPVSTEENEVIVNESTDSQNTITEQQNEPEESNDNSNTKTVTSIETEKEIVQENSVDPLADYVASVTIDGATEEYSDLGAAFNAADGKTATITILQDCVLNQNIKINGGNITVYGGGKTIVRTGGLGIEIEGGTVNVYDFNYSDNIMGINVRGGIFNFFSGNSNTYISSIGPGQYANGTVNIYGGTISAVNSYWGGSVYWIPNSITMQESNISMEIDSNHQLVANVDQNPIIVGGNNITISPAWTSSDESIVSVDAQGYLTANGIGIATITASAGGQTDTCTVTVKNVQDAPDISKLSVATTSDSLGFGYLGSSLGDNIDKLQYTYAKGEDESLPSEAQWYGVEVIGYTGFFVIENLEEGTPYTIFLRYKETDDCFASDVVSKAFYTFYKQPKPSIDYINEQLANLVANKEYKITLNASSEIATSDENGKIDIKEEWMGKDLKISVTGKPISEMSGNILIPTRPAAPESLEGEVTGSGVNDCKITGLEDNIAYEIYSENEQTWKEATVVNGEITGLSVGTYQVRIKASSSSFASLPATVTINKADSSIKFKQSFSLDKTYDAEEVIVTTDNVETTGSKGNITFSYEKKIGDTWEALSEAPTNAGTYRVTAYLEGDTNYNAAQSEEPHVFTISKAETSLEIKSDLTQSYNGQPVSNPEVEKSGSSKEVRIIWYEKDGNNWKELTSAPTDAGTYKVEVHVDEDENYNNANAVKEFSISQTTNEWTEELSITGWTYGEEAKTPTAKAKYGDVNFTYSDKENGTYTDTVPTDAGTWYVKATVTGNQNYTGLEAIKEFTISKANSSIAFKDGFKLDKTYDTKAVVVTADAVETAGSKGNISFSYEKKVGDTWETLSEAPTGAGTYRVTAILEEDTNYNFATSQPLEFTIGKAQIIVGFIQSNIDKEYDGKEVFVGTYQQGGSHATTKTWYQKLDDGTWKELTNTPKNAGSYKVVLKAEGNENYIGAQTEMTFEITKAVPTYTLPSGLTMKQGETLSSVVLPEGFTWKDETQKADTLGTQIFKATYTPEDTTNYQSVDVDITVDVVPATTPVNQPPVINAKDQTLTVGDKFDPMKGVTATDKEDGDLTDKIVITKNTVDTSKAGKYTIDYEVTDNGGTRVRKTIVVTVKEKATTNDEGNKSDTDKKTPSKDTAQTSTQTNMLAWTLLGLASAGAFITGLFKRKHQ